MHSHSWQGQALTGPLFPPCPHTCPGTCGQWHGTPTTPYLLRPQAHTYGKVPGTGLPLPAQGLWLHPPGKVLFCASHLHPGQGSTPTRTGPWAGRNRVLPRQFTWPLPALRQQESQRIHKIPWRTPYGT